MHRFTRNPLMILIFVGFILRLWFLTASNHIYFPDELYQSLEQAHRLVYGYGITTWDFVYGLRSYILPLLMTVPLWLLKSVGITAPEHYIYGPKVLLTLMSLSVIPAAYYITKAIWKNRNISLFSAFLMTTWYELIYFSPRALTETVSVYFFAAAAVAILRFKRVGIGAFFATVGLLLRIQYFPLFFAAAYYVYRKGQIKKTTIAGSGLALIAFGLADYYYYGSFLSHPLANIRLSFLSGISTQFGEQPWFFYLLTLLIGSSGLALLALHTIFKHHATRSITFTYISLILIHSLIGHKEYRFLFAAIPIWIMLVSYLAESWKSHRPALYFGAVVISLLGIAHALPYQTRLYGQPPLFKDPHLKLFTAISKTPAPCGIYDPTRMWVYTGGYYYLHQPIPIYTTESASVHPNSIGFLISDKSDLNLAGFYPVSQTERFEVYMQGVKQVMPGYTLYQRSDVTCNSQTVDYYRSFVEIQTRLTAVGAKPVLKGFRQ